MFKISPIQDIEIAKKYAMETDSEYIDGAFTYAMNDLESGDLMGISQFEITAEFGLIYSLKPKIGYQDFEAMFILGRQTMNFIDKCGVHFCKASLNSGDESLIKAIGFKHNDEYYECNMTGMFDGNCCNHS